jgi:hypothetical protein
VSDETKPELRFIDELPTLFETLLEDLIAAKGSDSFSDVNEANYSRFREALHWLLKLAAVHETDSRLIASRTVSSVFNWFLDRIANAIEKEKTPLAAENRICEEWDKDVGGLIDVRRLIFSEVKATARREGEAQNRKPGVRYRALLSRFFVDWSISDPLWRQISLPQEIYRRVKAKCVIHRLGSRDEKVARKECALKCDILFLTLIKVPENQIGRIYDKSRDEMKNHVRDCDNFRSEETQAINLSKPQTQHGRR